MDPKATIDIGMLFKKMYCQHCGTRLEVKKTTKIVHRGDEEFSSRMAGGMYNIGMNSYQQATYVYQCPNCHFEITYAAQCVIAEKQKTLKKKIISENDGYDDVEI